MLHPRCRFLPNEAGHAVSVAVVTQSLHLKRAADPVNDAQKTMNELQGELKKAADRMDLYKKYEKLGRELENCTGDTSELVKKQQDLWSELTRAAGNSQTSAHWKQKSAVQSRP